MSQDTSQPELKDKKINEETGREVIKNPSRGCGHLKSNSSYLRGDAPGHVDGTIPRFVEFENPLKYKIDSFKGVRRFPNGTDFLAKAVTEAQPDPGFDIKSKLGIEDEELNDMGETSPMLIQHISNYWADNSDYEDWNRDNSTNAFDLITYIGKSNYPDYQEFIEEVRNEGFNRGINPRSIPDVDPFRTRVFCVHPNAIEDEDGNTYMGIIGYAIVNRVIHTVDDDGKVPKHIEEKSENGKVDIVEKGEEQDKDAEEQTLEEAVNREKKLEEKEGSEKE